METDDQSRRAEQIYNDRLTHIQTKTDKLFAVLLLVQWGLAIVLALVISPTTWVVDQPYWHIHLWGALLLGGGLTVMPLYCVFRHPGKFTTRVVTALAQVGYSTLLIHLTGGRIETHFHVFGSLAFLAFYRDWRIFLPATGVVAADHVLRAYFWPESVFGITYFAPWRAIEHAAWVIFEDIFLVWGCLTSTRELREISTSQAHLENSYETIEHKVERRTRELAARTQELEDSIAKGNQLEMELLEAQKLESIGQLAAGIAHEINTPMQYVNDNVEFLSECSEKLFQVVDVYHHNLHDLDVARPWDDRIQQVEAMNEACRFDYIREQIPEAIAESKEGVKRVIEIVRAMKQLSHPGTDKKTLMDINEAIRSTVVVTKNRWKYSATVETELEKTLPQIHAFSAEINQVLINLIVNAADAIGEKNGNSGGLGKVIVRSRSTGDHIEIEVEDDGCGMPDEVRAKIFEPFYTTKKVGKGTGQGLAITNNVVVNHHQGTIDVETAPGQGTLFRVRLPRFSTEGLEEAVETAAAETSLAESSKMAELILS